VRKEDYGEPGSSDYRKNMAMATAALSEKFGVARHKIVAGGEEGDQAKHAHVQHVIVSIIHRVKEGRKRSEMMDFMDICNVSQLGGDLSSDNPVDWWDGTEIDLWKDWDLCSEEQIRRWQFSVNKFFSDGDRIASNWLQAFVYNSSTDSLRTAVAKKYDKLPPTQKGGVIYLFLTLREMFLMSREVKDAMLKFLEIFKRNGVSRYTGENVLVVSEEILGVCKRLDAVDALLDDHVFDVLAGLSICANKKFRDTFALLSQNAELDNLAVLGTIPLNATPMEQIEAILEKAVDMYDKLSTAQVWNRTSKGGPSAMSGTIVEDVDCWNCNGKGHQSKECTKPRNKALWEKNFKAFKEKRRTGGGGGSKGKGKTDSPDYNRKQWETHGISLVNGKLHVMCKKCGPNTTHSTGLHNEFIEKGSAFRLKASHPYAKECIAHGQSNPVISGSTATTNQPAPPSTAPTPAPPSGSSLITIDRNKLEQSLSDFERNSTDPNASQMSEMFRSLFLN
jgi:hypothetical protein